MAMRFIGYYHTFIINKSVLQSNINKLTYKTIFDSLKLWRCHEDKESP